MKRSKHMCPPINAMFNPSVSESEWLQEYFLPEENLDAFINDLGDLLAKNKVAYLNASVRFVKQNKESMFSYSRDGDRFAVVLCFNQPLQEHEKIKAKKWLRASQHMALNYGGTFYLPYQQVSSPEQVQHAYPVDEARKLKRKVDPEGIFTSGFYEKYVAKPSKKPNYFKKIMQSQTAKNQFAGFLENVLQRVDTDAFYALLEDILTYNDSHEEIYKELLARMSEITPNPISSFNRILNSLSTIKEDLGAQAKHLLGNDVKQINGLVEIGYPGRFINGFKENFKVTGKVVAVHEGESITDFIQAGLPKPYDQFAQLNYLRPNLKALADNSAEVITCYVGLHHFPKDELDVFLAEVRRVLKPNGRFLLVDHDVTDEDSLAMAHMAHMVFNAVNGVSVKEEMREIRNFHSMAYWQKKLQKFDLASTANDVNNEPDIHMIRKGDPSRNRMACFVNGPKPELVHQQSSTTNIFKIIPPGKNHPTKPSRALNDLVNSGDSKAEIHIHPSANTLRAADEDLIKKDEKKRQRKLHR
jgi:ubiquinone/menaquinone biosynthesis C-methylase UbiE